MQSKNDELNQQDFKIKQVARSKCELWRDKNSELTTGLDAR
jgi:hypothetical protein